MKVICIDASAEIDKNCLGNFKPIEGGVYNVLSIENWYNELWYTLAEDSFGNGWNPIYFIPLSDINEIKLRRKKPKIKSFQK